MDATILFFIKTAVVSFIKENNISHKGYKVGFYQINDGPPVMSAKIYRENKSVIEAKTNNGIDELLIFLQRSI